MMLPPPLNPVKKSSPQPHEAFGADEKTETAKRVTAGAARRFIYATY
jgi:hypothetical protein